MTRVLVNLTWLVPGVVGGSEESTTDALRAVASALATGPHAGEFDVRLAVLAPLLDAHPDLSDAYDCAVLDLSGGNKARRVWADQTWLTRAARDWRAEVVHHAGGVVPLRHPGRTVLTVHDLQPLDLPDNFSFAKRTYIRAMAARSLRAADVVVVPSEFTRDRVRAHGLPAGTPTVVVPWSMQSVPGDVGGRALPESAPESAPESVRGHRIVLYPAITYPHKNHRVLLDAFAELATHDDDVRLVLPGRAGPAEGDVRERITRPDLRGRVIRLGRVPADQLEAWYAAASLVVVPSRYEGFGLPALEAQARGVPVLASSAGSLPEVVDRRDVVDPDDVTGWAAAMRAVLDESPTELSARVADGRRRAASWSPERTAAGLLEAYRMAATPAGGASS